MENKTVYKISIRNLIELILRSGDIVSGFSKSNRAVEGTKIHKKIQNDSGSEYESEVTLRYTADFDEFSICVEGRADGVIKEKDSITIDEIKTTTIPLENMIQTNNILHWAQVKCYAFIYGNQEELSEINAQLTYYNIDSGETTVVKKTFSYEELSAFFNNLIKQYYLWLRAIYYWNKIKINSIKDLKFPFDIYRKGQRKVAVAVYRTIVEGKKIYIQAPTGIGKTISTIFPAIKAMGEGHVSKIFYLTSKTTTRTAAYNALELMRKHGLEIKVTTITAKEKICFKENVNCNPELCEYACGHYDRINSAIKDIGESEYDFSKERIEYYAKKHKICPFEFSLDLALWSDFIICDYNYIFHPSIQLKALFFENKEEYAILIDEAHNLVDRAREIFSASINKQIFLDMKNKARIKYPKLSKKFQKINRTFLDIWKENNETKVASYNVNLDYLYQSLRTANKYIEDYLIEYKEDEIYEDLLQVYFDISFFLKVSEMYGENYLTIIDKVNRNIEIKLFCLEPSLQIKAVLSNIKSSVLFSATLIPIEYYKDVLGGNVEDYTIQLSSPFDKSKRLILIDNNISTKYNFRDASSLPIVEQIRSFIDGKQGNYIVYLPSYEYMNKIYTIFTHIYPQYNTYIQEPGMNEVDAERFLSFFSESPNSYNIGFCVLGGIFSEGIDLKNDRLIGVVVVGVGLPNIYFERDLIKNYFNGKNGMGYEYAYMYPGMNKVLQAVGRLIRTEDDRGIMLLIDERYSHYRYKKLFPKDWYPFNYVNGKNIRKIVNVFWRNHKG